MKQQGHPQGDALPPLCKGGGPDGEGGDQVSPETVAAEESAWRAFDSQGFERYPAGCGHRGVGLPFKYLQGRSSASASLSLQIQGILYAPSQGCLFLSH